MKPIISHLIIPAIMPLLFAVVVINPAGLLDCRLRGLLALVMAFISISAALVTTVIGLKKKLGGGKDYSWWLGSTLILILPALALLIWA